MSAVEEHRQECLCHQTLVFAVEDEVREGLEGAGVFGETGAVEAGFGADGVFEGEVAGAVEGAGIADESYQGYGLDRVEFFLFEDARDHFAGFAVAVFHGVDEWKGDFAFFQIAEDGLAELLAGSGEIQKIIHELKRQAGIAAVVGERVFVFLVEAAEDSAEAGAAAGEGSGLVCGKFQGVFFGDVNTANFFELQEFAFDHFLREIYQDVEDVEIALLQGDVERLHVQPVAGEDAAMIAPAGVGGGAATACVGAINHIVVDKGGAVEEFDDGGELDGAAGIAIASGSVAVSEQEQCGAETLPSPAEKIAGDFGDGLVGGGALAREFLLDLYEVFAH